MCKISIVMPVYNGAEFLEKSIVSVAKQTLKDLELICVDDGSSDNSVGVLENLSEEYDFIKIVTQENSGAGPARNNGIRNSSGEYIAFLDADDEFYDEDALERMYNANTTDADMVSANLIMIKNNDEIAGNFFYDLNDYKYFSSEEIIKPEEYGAPLSFYKSMFKREFLIENDIVFPNFRRGQDPPFLAKVLTLIDRIQAVPVYLYGHHYKVGGGAENKINTYEKKRGYMQHFRDTCDILAEGGLKDLSDFYKIHLFRYLTKPESVEDPVVYDLFEEMFDLDKDGFDTTDFNYTRYMIVAKLRHCLKNDSEEYFTRINKEFMQDYAYAFIEITDKILDYYFLVTYSYSLEDLKSNYDKYLNRNSKFLKEFDWYKIKRTIFNIERNGMERVHENAKKIILNSVIWREERYTNTELKILYDVITDNYEIK